MNKLDIINLAIEKGYDYLHPTYLENYGDDVENWCVEMALLQKWLRDKYHIYIRVATNGLRMHFPMIEIVTLGSTQGCGGNIWRKYDSYEEALDEAIYEALTIL